MRCPGLARLGFLLVLLLAVPAQARLAPTGEPFVLTSSLEGRHGSPVLAARPDGTYLMVWKTVLPIGGSVLYGGFFGPSGAPLAPPFEIQAGATSSAAVAIQPDGGFVIAWEQAGEILGSAYDRDGHLRMPRFQVASGSAPRLTPKKPDVAVGTDGGWVVVWEQDVRLGSPDAFGRWFGPDGTPKTSAVRIAPWSSDYRDEQAHPQVEALPDGEFLVVWNSHWTENAGGGDWSGVSALRFNDAGEATSSELFRDAGGLPRLLQSPGKEGFLVFEDFDWSTHVWPSGLLTFMRLDARGEKHLPDMNIHFPQVPESGVRHGLAIDPAGRLLLIGTAKDQQVYSQLFEAASMQPLNTPSVLPTARPGTRQPALASARPGQFLTVWEDAASGHILGEVLALGCEAGSGLCLNQNRFRVEVSWRDHQGNTGVGRPVPLTDDTASFWFFTSSNVELLVKVLDGRGVNGKFWVFYGSLSDVEYEIRVEDTLTGDVRTYKNPAGTLASRADVLAFPPSAEARETVTTALEEIPVVGRSTVAPLTPPIFCHSSDVALCLQPLYQVTVEFVDPLTGADRQARAVPFSQESGAFWFFDEDNLELFVKVLDGTAINGRAWVFHGALTDVEYTITVRDLLGAEWTYHNPRGRMHSGADTSALPPPLQF
ncbi:MAG TPA: hypothetical protein VJ885_00540 [Thermoanaerobaculia bacterium]|nr:hypothetical protein [Thermoanaerobaculia bacterium]